MHASPNPEITILFPCLNEEETLAHCLEAAQHGLAEANIAGEILVADNGSTDRSLAIAARYQARVISIQPRGYGHALQGGFQAARTPWIVMADADGSYDVSLLSPFVEKLRAGCDLVIGCRFPAGGGTIRPGAMPWKNRWLGNPLLSFLGQLLFKTRVRDFHCGLRAVTRSAYDRLDLQTTGMEFASEMVIKAALKKMVIAEVPVVLHRDGRLRPPHLRPWRDGWRHLRFMLLFSPLWLFLVPGLFFVSFGGVMGAFLTAGSLPLGPIRLDINSLVICAMSLMLGFELCLFAVFTRAFAILAGFLPESERIHFFHRHFSLEKGLGAGLTLMGLGLGLIFFMIWQWGADHFGALPQPENLRRIIPAALLFTLGLQVIFSSFFLSILSVQRLSGPRSATP